MDSKNPLLFPITDFGAGNPLDHALNNDAFEKAIASASQAMRDAGSGQGVGRRAVVYVPPTTKPWRITRPILIDAPHVHLAGDPQTASAVELVGLDSVVMLAVPRAPVTCFDPSTWLDGSVDASLGKMIGIRTGPKTFMQFQGNALQLGQRLAETNETLDGWRTVNQLTIDAFVGYDDGFAPSAEQGVPLFGLGSAGGDPSPWAVRMVGGELDFAFRTRDQGPVTQWAPYRSVRWRLPERQARRWRLSIQVDLRLGVAHAWVDGVYLTQSSAYNWPAPGAYFAENLHAPFMLGSEGLDAFGGTTGSSLLVAGLKLSNRPLYRPQAGPQQRLDDMRITDQTRYFRLESSTLALLPMTPGPRLDRSLVSVSQGEASYFGLASAVFTGGDTSTFPGRINQAVKHLHISGWHGGAGIHFGRVLDPVIEDVKIGSVQDGIASWHCGAAYRIFVRDAGVNATRAAFAGSTCLARIDGFRASAGRVTLLLRSSHLEASGVEVRQPSASMLNFARVVPGEYCPGGLTLRDSLHDLEGHTFDDDGALIHAAAGTMWPAQVRVDGLQFGTVGQCPVFELAEPPATVATRPAELVAAGLAGASVDYPSLVRTSRRWSGRVDARTLDNASIDAPDGGGPVVIGPKAPAAEPPAPHPPAPPAKTRRLVIEGEFSTRDE